ncbi:unnamed protein product, partial [Brenthis ino]
MRNLSLEILLSSENVPKRLSDSRDIVYLYSLVPLNRKSNQKIGKTSNLSETAEPQVVNNWFLRNQPRGERGERDIIVQRVYAQTQRALSIPVTLILWWDDHSTRPVRVKAQDRRLYVLSEARL